MEFTITVGVLVTSICAIASFLLGLAAEITRIPPSMPEQLNNDKFKCMYPNDPSPFYSYIALACIVISTLAGSLHKYHSSNGVKAPIDAYSSNILLKIFFIWAMFMEGLSFYMIFQPLYTMQRLRNETYDHLIEMCPTAGSGVSGGGALTSLGAGLLWIIVFVLAKNCRDDFTRGNDGNSSIGSYGPIEEDVDGGW